MRVDESDSDGDFQEIQMRTLGNMKFRGPDRKPRQRFAGHIQCALSLKCAGWAEVCAHFEHLAKVHYDFNPSVDNGPARKKYETVYRYG